jgi:antirestriction protein
MVTSTSRSFALPYVTWATSTIAEVPAEEWERVYSSMQALKAHVQEYPGCQKFEAYVEPVTEGGAVRIQAYTIWDTPEQLEAFLERGYTLERMLRDVSGVTPEETRIMEKVF